METNEYQVLMDSLYDLKEAVAGLKKQQESLNASLEELLGVDMPLHD